VSQKTLSNIETGKTVPNILQIAKLGAIYELDMIEFLEKSGIFFAPPPPPPSPKLLGDSKESKNQNPELDLEKVKDLLIEFFGKKGK